jgi:hypothetical protein
MTESTATTVPRQAPSPAGSVACLYCSIDISSDAFLPWSSGSRLSSAACGGCGRRVTLTSESLRQLGGYSPMTTP